MTQILLDEFCNFYSFHTNNNCNIALFFFFFYLASWKMTLLASGNWNINEFDMNEILKASLATLELGILEPRAQILGGVVIFDMNGFTLQHAYQITPKVVSTIFDLIVVRMIFPFQVKRTDSRIYSIFRTLCFM